MTRRIAYLMAYDLYPYEGRTIKFLSSFKNFGGTVRVFSLSLDPHSTAPKEISGIPIERVDLSVFRFIPSTLFGRIRWLLDILFLFWRIRDFSPNIIFCMNFETLHLGYFCRLFLGIDFVYESQELYPENHYCLNLSAFRQAFHRFWERFIAKRAALIIQSSPSRARRFKELYGLPAISILNKSFACSDRTLKFPELESFREDGRFLLCYVGGIQVNRGLEQILEAIRDLTHVRFCILGTPFGEWGKRFIEAHKDRVTFFSPKPQHEIAAFLQHFDLGLSLIQNSCPSYFLECPTKTWELIAAGIPQIASDFPEIRRILLENDRGPLGLVVNPSDVGEIRRAIIQVSTNPEFHTQLKRNLASPPIDWLWASEEHRLGQVLNELGWKVS